MTGDVGVVLPNGAVKIIDRCKNIFKLSQGEYIAPEKIEQALTLSDYIAQIMICGDSLRHCTVAIVTPDEERMKAWATANSKETSACFEDPDFKAEIMDDIIHVAAK